MVALRIILIVEYNTLDEYITRTVSSSITKLTQSYKDIVSDASSYTKEWYIREFPTVINNSDICLRLRTPMDICMSE